MRRRVRVMMLGFRGFPGVQGGVEAHAQHLCRGLAQLDWEVEAAMRGQYVTDAPRHAWRGVRILKIWAPRHQMLEAIVHTVLGVLVAAWRRPAILHIHAVGPAIVSPIARALGLRVVVTHHGPDYDREKWGIFAKMVLRCGERMGVRFANEVIAVSQGLQADVARRYGRRPVHIRNGVAPGSRTDRTSVTDRFGLSLGRYFLMVGRISPEKRHQDAIEAFSRLHGTGWKLVIVGGANHLDRYSAHIDALAEAMPDVILAGFQHGNALAQFYSHAGAFVLPSSHEGMPIALLEALGYGLNVIASDIGANLEIGLPRHCYFPAGDVAELERLMRAATQATGARFESARQRRLIAMQFGWGDVVAETESVYESVLGTVRRKRAMEIEDR
jgi:glycosyltransferase involved in cell wall biosynthesis